MSGSPTDLPRIGMSRTVAEDHWPILCGACSDIREIDERSIVNPRHKVLDTSLLLLDGLVGRQIPRRDGNRVHLVALGVPGDFIDLHAYPLKWLDHHVTTYSKSRAAIFRHDALSDLIDTRPDLGREIWSMTLVDASIHRHWAFRNGSMRALARVANFLCEMRVRLQSAGRGDGPFDLPLFQTDIGDACGMTNVHVSRVLRQLREAGCCRLVRGRLIVDDVQKLHKIGQFDPRYLYLPDAPQPEPDEMMSGRI